MAATKFLDAGGRRTGLEAGVTSNDGKRSEKVTIMKQGDHYFAKRDNEPSIYELDRKAVEDLHKGSGDVKELQPAKPRTGKKK